MRIPLLLYGLALAVRLVLIAQFPYPAYPDSAYYVDVARSLHAGAGFNIDFVWIFAEVGAKIPADPMLPIPSNAHWMPLASIVQVPFMAVFGDVAWAEALPFALIGAIAAPLTWAIARDFGAIHRVAVGAGILTAVPLLSAVYLVQPDNFSLFQPLVIGSLWLGARALRGSSPWAFVGAGLLAGLATLSRNDGLLVLAALGLAFAWDRWRSWRSAGTQATCDLVCLGRRLRRSVRTRHGPVVGAAVGRLRIALAIDRVGQGLLHPLDRGVEQHHDSGHARTAARHGAWAAAPDADRWVRRRSADLHHARRRRCARPIHAHRRLGAAQVARLRPVLHLRRSAVRVLGDRLGGPRAWWDLHPFRDRACTLQLHPGP